MEPSPTRIVPAPPADGTPSGFRQSPRKSIGTIQTAEASPTIAGVNKAFSPLASERQLSSSPSQDIAPALLEALATVVIKEEAVCEATPPLRAKARAVSMDFSSSRQKEELPQIGRAEVEWGTIYDDACFESPARSRTHSLDDEACERDGLEATSRKSLGGRGHGKTITGYSVQGALPRLDELKAISLSAAVPPPLARKNNSFRGRNSQTILSRPQAKEIEIFNAKGEQTLVASMASISHDAAESDTDTDFTGKEDELRASYGTQETTVTHAEEHGGMRKDTDDGTLVMTISRESSMDDVDDMRSSLARTSVEERPSGFTLATVSEVAETATGARKSLGRAPTVLTNAHVLQFHRHLLSEYEITEILDFRSVYFFGHDACKIDVIGEVGEILENNGFDDKDGNFIAREGSHIAYRYEVASQLGKGSFGIVHKCVDHKDMKYVAVKIVKNRKRFHKQVTNEIKILELIRDHQDFASSNCIRLQEKFMFRKHMCLCFPLSGRSIFDFMRANDFKPNSKAFVLRVARQLLSCLAFLYNLDIIHCDLKPENILLVEEVDFTIKLIDFGSSCMVSEKVFQYIQSRYYRAPEVIFGLGYGKAIDMWSFACILPELRYGDALITGKSEADQLCATAEVIGAPPEEMLLKTKKSEKLGIIDGVLQYTTKKTGKRRPGSRTINKLVSKRSDALFKDFLVACLKWDPAERLVPEAALQHAWITTDDQA